MKKNINNIVIEAKRWFDKINDNTYHSVRVYVNGEYVAEEPFTYGYDNQYLQTAHKLLQTIGVYPITNKRLSSGGDYDYYNFQNDMRKHRNKFIITVADVGRKKDL